ncbi:MAG: AraC family transcriptional regulator [Clostridiales bacterium]|nr:AraC family transcriptional regulator [Clostridiales bacterium]
MFNNLLIAIENGILNSSGALPVVFEGIEHVFEKTGKSAGESMHDTHELLYMRDGESELSIEGKILQLRKGDILIIRPHMVHALLSTSKKAEILSLYFGFIPSNSDITLSGIAGVSGSRKTSKVNKTGPTLPLPKLAQTSLESFMQFATEGGEDLSKDPYFVVSGSYKHDVADISERIISEMGEDKQSKDLMLQLLTVELMIVLSRTMRSEWEESLRVKTGKAKELVFIAKNFIDTNYDRGITVTDAASYVFLSQGYFTRAFKDEIGVSPMSYLMNVRIAKACELLNNRDIKVSAIATSVGFASAQRFNVAFKKYMGLTPMDYRKKSANKSERS